MSNNRTAADTEVDWPEMVVVDDEDRVWDDELGHHRCPLGLIQTPREIVGCIEWDREGGLKLFVRQLEREGICDVVVADEDEQEVSLRAITCGYDHQRARYPRNVTVSHKWYELPPLNGRRLYDAETDREVWVDRIEDAIRASEITS